MTDIVVTTDARTQEYYIRHKDGRTVDSNAERQKVSRCLVAAVERRASHVSQPPLAISFLSVRLSVFSLCAQC